jgi:ATP-dependent Clp protease ATP-binding subunit ClpB
MSSIGFQVQSASGQLSQEETFKTKTLEALREHFRPEFLNRIDDVVVFNPLKPKDLEQIVDIQLSLIHDRLNERRIKLSVDAPAKKYLVAHGFDPDFGARPLKRLIQKVILDALADKIIRGEVKDGDKIKVNCKADSLVLSV